MCQNAPAAACARRFLMAAGRGICRITGISSSFPNTASAVSSLPLCADPLERAYSAYTYLRGNHMGARAMQAQALVSSYRDFDQFVAGWLHPENLRRQLHFAPRPTFWLITWAGWLWIFSAVRNRWNKISSTCASASA